MAKIRQVTQDDDILVPKEYLVSSLLNQFDQVIKTCSALLEKLPMVYPLEELEDGPSTFHQIVEFLTRLRELSVVDIPYEDVQSLSSRTSLLHDNLSDLLSHASQKDPSMQEISDLISESDTNFRIILGVVQPWLGFLIMKKAPIFDLERVYGEIGGLQYEQERAIADLTASVQEAVAKADAAAASIVQKDEIAAEALGDIGVSRHAKEFKDVQDEHAKAAQNWFWGSGAVIAVTSLVAVLLYELIPIEGSWDSPVNVHRVLLKIAVLTTLFYLISQCVKNYRVNRHLEVVNRHRATALRTFRTFVENAKGDTETRQAILLETTKTIFAPVSTGYVESEDDGPNSRIIEMVNIARGK